MELAVVLDPAEISGPVDPAVPTFGVGQKQLGCQLGPSPVSRREVGAAHGDLAGHPRGLPTPLLIQDQDLHVLHRKAAWHVPTIDPGVPIQEELPYRANLGGSQPAREQCVRTEMLPERLEVALEHHLAAQLDESKVIEGLPRDRPDKLTEYGCHRAVDGDPVAAQPPGQWTEALYLQGIAVEAGSVQKDIEDVPDPAIHAARIEQAEAILGTQVKLVGVAHGVVQHIAVCLEHTLGPSCRSGGIEERGDPIRAGGHIGVLAVSGAVAVHMEDGTAGSQRSRLRVVGGIGDQHGRLSILQEEAVASLRVPGVEGSGEAACLQDAQERGDEGGSLIEEYGNRAGGAGRQGEHSAQCGGNPAGGRIQLAVGQPLRPVLHGQSPAVKLHHPGESLGNGLLDRLPGERHE